MDGVFVMNKWDRVEKKKRATTHQDIQMEYVKNFSFLFHKDININL